MREVAIVSPVRTPVGNFGGALRDIPAEELGALVIRDVLERTQIDHEKVDDVILGQGYPNGEASNIGRYCALKAGLPEEVPGMQIDRRCSSGLQAVITAAMMIQTGNADVVIAGGVESMSNVEYYTGGARWGARFGSSFTTVLCAPGSDSARRSASGSSPGISRPRRTWPGNMSSQERSRTATLFKVTSGR